MPPHLRLERRHPSGWTLAHGPSAVGWIADGRLALTDFPDASSAAVAAEIAARVIRQWHQHRAADALDPTVHLLDDALGFSCAVPLDAWSALLLELAQRLHVATLSLRHPHPEPAA